VLQHPYLRVRLFVIEKIDPPPGTQITISAWREALSKLKAWTLTDYKKLIYLDGTFFKKIHSLEKPTNSFFKTLMIGSLYQL
jgi:alpha-N-acetylglucosamine transferase